MLTIDLKAGWGICGGFEKRIFSSIDSTDEFLSAGRSVAGVGAEAGAASV